MKVEKMGGFPVQKYLHEDTEVTRWGGEGGGWSFGLGCQVILQGGQRRAQHVIASYTSIALRCTSNIGQKLAASRYMNQASEFHHY